MALESWSLHVAYLHLIESHSRVLSEEILHHNSLPSSPNPILHNILKSLNKYSVVLSKKLDRDTVDDIYVQGRKFGESVLDTWESGSKSFLEKLKGCSFSGMCCSHWNLSS